jgi:hypothetical protein
MAGRRVGIVKKIGGKFAGSFDNFQTTYDSPTAVLRKFGSMDK